MSRGGLSLLAALVLGCGAETEQVDGPLPWRHVATVAFDAANGQTPPVALSPGDARVALRVSGAAGECFQVSGALDGTGQSVAHPYSGPYCADCAWRTSPIHHAGLLVLEGVAAGLSQIRFRRVACGSGRALPGVGALTLERLDQPLAATGAGLAVRLIASVPVDLDRFAHAVSGELAGLPVHVVETAEIGADDLRLGPGDHAPLAALLATLPPRPAGAVDVVVGPCLTREDPFGARYLAGLTPRVPGGAGPADAVFVSRAGCGLRLPGPEDPARLARVAAHELGHYLGLFHAEDADGSADDLPDTPLDNLMHRLPLRAAAQGLTGAQQARLWAHPSVGGWTGGPP